MPLHCRYNAVTLPLHYQVAQTFLVHESIQAFARLDGIVTLVSWRYVGGKLAVRWWHVGGTLVVRLVVRWRYVGGTLAVRWRHVGGKLAVRWRYVGGTLVVRWWSVWGEHRHVC